MDRVARELELDRAELRARNMIRPEQMPYSVGLVFRDGKPLVYASGDFPKSQRRALALSDYEGFRARQAKARAEGPLSRHRHRATTSKARGSGPFEGVTVRVLPNGKVAVATGATTQGQGTRTTLVADRGRRGRLPHRGHRHDRRRYRGHLAGDRRLCQPAGDQRRLVRADRRSERAQTDRRTRRPHARRAGERYRRRGRPRHRPRRQQAVDRARRARADRAGHAGLFLRRRPGARPRAHGLFHAAAGLVLQRHARRGGRGRSFHRRCEAPRLHGCPRQRKYHQSR